MCLTLVLSPYAVTLVLVDVLEEAVVEELAVESGPLDAVVTTVDGAVVETVVLLALVADMLGEAEVVDVLATEVLLASNRAISPPTHPSQP